MKVPDPRDIVKIGVRYIYLKDGSKAPRSFANLSMLQFAGTQWMWSTNMPRLNDRWRMKARAGKMMSLAKERIERTEENKKKILPFA